jgi:PqqD family protein of HPr-rel-A system
MGEPIKRSGANILEADVDGDLSVYNPESEQVTVLNSSATEIWRLIDGRLSLTEIVDRLAESYDVDPDTIMDEVQQTVTSLTEAGLVETTD